MDPGGPLLIIEMVLPAGDTPHPGKMLDMIRTLPPFNCKTQLKVLALYELKGSFRDEKSKIELPCRMHF